MEEKRHRYKGVIIDGRVYIAVKDTHYYRLRERCELARDGLCEDVIGNFAPSIFGKVESP